MTEFEKIFLENRDMIYRLLLKLSGNPSVAEELLEEAFSRGYMNFSSLRDKGKISVWLCQIAKNLYFAFYNEQKKYLLTVQKTRRMKLPTKQNCDTGSYQGLTENFFKFAEFTLTIEDAQEYVYSISPTRRVKAWRDIEVKLYI